MSEALIGLLSASLTALIAVGGTLWAKRRSSPESEANMLTASTLLLAQLQARVAALETRVAILETENAEYHHLYGPLPR